MISAASWRGFEVLIVSPTPTHPQDHGNRKRIFEICRALRERGAKVHFVHYPGEHDWRYDRPARHEAAMAAEWDSYQLVPATRPLHEPAAGSTHDIDEWADPSVTGYLAWVCQRRRFDLAIVNYTWMSFALEAIPSSIYKTLDTHDVFGDRRQLLASIGVEPEFFYTTPDDEARGLKRADLVWAIKESEREYFQRDLGVTNSLTVLHAEPQRGWWTTPPSQDGWLRAGVIGARNNLNRRNLEKFLEVSLPVFAKYMAPVKIVIAGGCSDDFQTLHHPNVEVVGRVPEVESFYRSVDVVIVPMSTSTGLKIKVCEAFASGAPVVAHAHAMDGYLTAEPLHQLPDFETMAREIAKLSFDRTPLARLAAKSRAICVSIRVSVDAALEATRVRVVAKLSEKVCLIAPIQALDAKSMLYDHFHSAADYLRVAAGVEVFFTGGDVQPEPALLCDLNLQHHVFVDPELWASLATQAPETWTPMKLRDLLAARGYARAYVMADCRDEFLFGTGALRQVFVRHDLIEIGGGDPDALIERLRKSMKVVVIGALAGPILPWAGKSGIGEVVRATMRRTGKFNRLAAARGDGLDLLLLAPANDVVADELAKLCRKLGARVRALDPADPATARNLVHDLEGADKLMGLPQAKILVDLSPPTSLSAVVCEAAMREGVVCIAFVRGPAALGLWRFPDSLRPASLRTLLQTVAEALASDEKMTALRAAAAKEIGERTANDAGWRVLWRLFTAPRKPASNEEAVSEYLAALFR